MLTGVFGENLFRLRFGQPVCNSAKGFVQASDGDLWRMLDILKQFDSFPQPEATIYVPFA